jgi:hypothetical protein
MKVRLISAICCWYVLSMVALGQVLPKSCSCQADVFVPEMFQQKRSVPSPNGRYQVVMGGYFEYYEGEDDYEAAWLRVLEKGRILRQYRLRRLSAGIFVKWAPDSRAFYVMWSNGGRTGGYNLRVFRVLGQTVTETRGANVAFADFRGKHYCESRGNNAYAVRWADQANRLLVAAEVYPTSDCGQDAGLESGYLIDIGNGRILRRYSHSEISAEMKECPSQYWPTAFWDQSDIEKAKGAQACPADGAAPLELNNPR